VDGALLGSDTLLPPGQSFEFVATFAGDAFQHAGFALTFNENLWVMFTTGTGGPLRARSHDGTIALDTPIAGDWLGAPHHYRIDWSPTGIVFRIDGVEVAAHSLVISTPMRPMFSDFATGGSAILVDSFWIGPYANTGTFTSRVLDATKVTNWAPIESVSQVPARTALSLSARFGNTPIPDTTWTPFSTIDLGSATTSATSQYVQYRAQLSGDGEDTPIVERVTFRGVDVPNLPDLSVADITVIEGSTGTTYAAFVVSMSSAALDDVVASYSTSDDSAAAGSDYTATSGTIIIPAGTTSVSILVPVITDGNIENVEAFQLTLSSPVNGDLADAQAVATILDDDVPSLFLNDANVIESAAGTSLLFTVTLSPPSEQTVSVQYSSSDGTAVASTDYTAVSGSLVFPPGTTTRQVAVPITGDTRDEPDESMALSLTAADAPILRASGIGTIVDDDPPPSISISNATVNEADSGPTPATFTVALSAPSGRVVTVAYDTDNETAVAPGDFAETTGSLTFEPGETTKLVEILVAGDGIHEPTETFRVSLTFPTNATIGDGVAVGTIVDNDLAPISIADTVITEGNTGTLAALFTVTLGAAVTQPVLVDYATVPGLATAPADFIATTGTATIPAGSLSVQVSVPVVGDVLDEGDETFTVLLSAPVGAVIADGSATATITDNDATPTLVVNNIAVTEGHTGTVAATFTVTLSAASGQTVTVNYATANATAVAPGDYAAASGTLTFSPGIRTLQVQVTVNGDTLEEPNETYQVNLTAPVNATLADAQGIGTITDDDPPTVTIANRTVTEGNTGVVNAGFTVSLSNAWALPVTVDFTTANGSATAPDDYSAVSGSVTIPAGATSTAINVPVVGDLLDEINETFTVTISNSVNATITTATATGTITDNDATPALVVNDVSVTETDAGTATATFTVTLSAVSGRTVTVNYATANATATAPGDYTATSGTLTFLPGSATTQQVTITVASDIRDEADETFQLRLSSAVAATIADGTGVATIFDNDPTPTATINDVTIVEANTGTRAMTFTVTLSAASNRTITIGFATADGTAVAPGDYTAATGTLTFSAGALTRTITITTIGDTVSEPNETLFVNLTTAINVIISDAQGIGTINNND
jgi:hypothetical protein